MTIYLGVILFRWLYAAVHARGITAPHPRHKKRLLEELHLHIL